MSMAQGLERFGYFGSIVSGGCSHAHHVSEHARTPLDLARQNLLPDRYRRILASMPTVIASAPLLRS
ncbi:hypothetical protein BFF94_034455 [Burkholderia catarinensis]|nr:hypothetical protein BFF94_034455 [Burkholderia catarinensis]